MSNDILNLFIKFHEHGSGEFEGIRTMEEHLKVCREKGKVIWGHFTSSLSKKGLWDKKTEIFDEQNKKGIDTFVFFCDRENKLLYVGKYINSYKRAEVEQGSELLEYIPPYYHHKVGTPKENIENELRSYAYIEVADIKEIDFKNVDSIYIQSKNDGSQNENILDNRGMASILYVNIEDELYNDLVRIERNNDINKGDNISNKPQSEKKEALNTVKDVKKYIEYIHSYILSKGFIYTYEELANFYLSLKTKPFVILAGISGTGKSKLVRLFAEAIGANSSNERFDMISVKPDWNDNTELIGYKNINDEFVPGRLIEIIREAIKYQDRPYIICLDEMNLARVEYYLSDYLSIIESRIKDNGSIITDPIFKDSYFKTKNNYSDLYIPENIYIIGTVNMDDTTYAFSRKVLDRANTIEFSKVDLDYLDFGNENIEADKVSNGFLKTDYLNIKDIVLDNNNKSYISSINEKIVRINSILKKGNKHFGYRVRDEIVFYMFQNKTFGLLDENTAFDFQIMQKVLPTITGSDLRIKDILISLYNFCNPTNLITDIPTYIEDAVKFLPSAIYKKSAEKIIEMLRGIEDGFTSYWI